MKLISMTDFVLETLDMDVTVRFGIRDKVKIIRSYANFLKQPLELGMFVPCGRDGKPLRELKYSEEYMSQHSAHHIELREYREAKDRILFEGFKYIKEGKGTFDHVLTLNNSAPFPFVDINQFVEDYTTWDLTLTLNAIKQLGL